VGTYLLLFAQDREDPLSRLVITQLQLEMPT
jgi:hypothetical protein